MTALGTPLGFPLGGGVGLPTRLELMTRARVRADQDGEDFPTNDQYNSFLNEAGKTVFADLVMSGWPMDYTTATIVANGTSQRYAVDETSPVFAITMVYTQAGGQFTELKRVNPGHMAALRTSGGFNGFSQFYEARTGIAGAIIEFFPRVAGTYFVDYILDFAGFPDDTFAWNGPPRSDELIVLQAAAKGCRKEGRKSDASALDDEYNTLLLKVKELASWYDMRNPAEMRDTRPLAQPFGFRDVDYFAGPGGMF